MRERVFSLETEYAIAFQPDGAGRRLASEVVVEAMRLALVKELGLPDSNFLVNGSKFAHDVGHAEWSLPECRGAREAAIYDKAADYQLQQIIPAAEALLAGQGHAGQLRVVKNNTDPAGNSYGCHENYLTLRESEWLSREDQLRLTIRCLVAFLVTRQVLCGAGRVGWGRAREEGAGYQIMQRADFISAVVSKDTRGDRAVINIGREDEPLAGGPFRRLHLILADANMSGWATYLKLGTTGLLLRMLEELHFGNFPQLVDPLDALRRISRDPTCRATVALRDGRRLTAIEIQRLYLAQARDYLAFAPALAEERQLLDLWQEALQLLESRPDALVGRVDWITKKAILDRYLAKNGLDWDKGLSADGHYARLLEIDIQYHNLSLPEGLFLRLAGSHDAYFPAAAIEAAAATPPAHTRARVRGEVIAAARRTGSRVKVDKWTELTLGRTVLDMSDPLEFFLAEVYALLGEQPAATPDEVSATDRAAYSLAIYAVDKAHGQTLAEALAAKGYQQPTLAGGAHRGAARIQSSEVPPAVIDDVIAITCGALGIARGTIQTGSWYAPGRIVINLP